MASNKGLGKGLGALLGDYMEQPPEENAYKLLSPQNPLPTAPIACCPSIR